MLWNRLLVLCLAGCVCGWPQDGWPQNGLPQNGWPQYGLPQDSGQTADAGSRFGPSSMLKDGKLRTWRDLASSRLLREFREYLASQKRLRSDIAWYPYDSLEAFRVLQRFQQCRDFGDLIRGGPILDLGCGDGDVAFFLERLGYEVRAVDHAGTNHNGMKGVHVLAERLGSRIPIHDIDVDYGGLESIGARYSLAIMLGVLYHLKNPLGVLKDLAGICRHCLLSTRIAARTPDRKIDFSEQPLVYLAGEREVNNDSTNYWIFSRSALDRLFQRSAWDVLDWFGHGCRENSDPASEERDERVFCLLRSRLADPWYRVRPLEGIYEAEGGWSWTAGRFSFLVDNAVHVREQAHADVGLSDLRIEFEFTVPQATWSELGVRTLSASANGCIIGAMVLERSGRHVFSAQLPDSSWSKAALHLQFQLDKVLPPTPSDARELGVIVSAVDADYNLRLISR